MTAEQKLGHLQWQIDQAELGVTKLIQCPYCNVILDFSPPSIMTQDWQPPTCCAEFALAVIAILQRKEQTEVKDLAERIRRNADGSPVFN